MKCPLIPGTTVIITYLPRPNLSLQMMPIIICVIYLMHSLVKWVVWPIVWCSQWGKKSFPEGSGTWTSSCAMGGSWLGAEKESRVEESPEMHSGVGPSGVLSRDLLSGRCQQPPGTGQGSMEAGSGDSQLLTRPCPSDQFFQGAAQINKPHLGQVTVRESHAHQSSMDWLRW